MPPLSQRLLSSLLHAPGRILPSLTKSKPQQAGFSSSHKPHPHPKQNHLLAALSPEVQNRLFPHLELAELPLRALMYEAGRPMRHVYFPTDSIISMQYLMENGASTAISVVASRPVPRKPTTRPAWSRIGSALIERTMGRPSVRCAG